MIGQFTRLLEYTFHKEADRAGLSGLSCQPPGARQFPFSRDLDLHTSRLLPLTSYSRVRFDAEEWIPYRNITG